MREAFAHELTDAQLKFIWLAKQERERMKQEQAEKNSPSMPSTAGMGGTPSVGGKRP